MNEKEIIENFGESKLNFVMSYKYSLTFSTEDGKISVSTHSSTDNYRSEAWQGMTINQLLKEYPLEDLSFSYEATPQNSTARKAIKKELV